MSLLGTFGRALIWTGVREAAYEQRRARNSQRRGVVTGPRPSPSSPKNREVKVQFVCAKGHPFERSFYQEPHPNEHDLSSARCPECGSYSRWVSMDYHIENQ